MNDNEQFEMQRLKGVLIENDEEINLGKNRIKELENIIRMMEGSFYCWLLN